MYCGRRDFDFSYPVFDRGGRVSLPALKMALLASILAAIPGLVALPAAAAPTMLWSVGAPDRSGREFALFGHSGEFRQRFPGTVHYRIGASGPSDWPYIQPGPVDGWAGSTIHTLAIDFSLPARPRGRCALFIDTVSTQRDFPPTLSVRINQVTTTVSLPPGSGDMALSDEKKGAPHSTSVGFDPSLLQAGPNEITLTITSGSWLLYDAVQLENDPSGPALGVTDARLEPTHRFVRRGGHLMQALSLVAYNAGFPLAASVEVIASGWRSRQPVNLGFGETETTLAIPPVSKPTPVSASLNAPGGPFRLSTVLNPERHWTIYIVPSAHNDIGYTAPQADVRRRHEENLDTALRLCAAEPWFRYNCEVAWDAECYLADRPAAKGRELIRRMRQGRIGLHAGYLNMLTGLMSTEEITRYARFAARLGQAKGIDTSTAILSDVPSAVWSVEPALAGSGVRFFSEGVDQARGPTLDHTGIDAPFYWVGPDGSRILTWLSRGYHQSRWLTTRSMSQIDQHVDALVSSYSRSDYPSDCIYVYGAFGDNGRLDPRYGALVPQWNARWAYPKIVLATSAQFLAAMTRKYGRRIPEKRGDFGAYWEDGAASSARETAMSEQAKSLLGTAETLWSLAKVAGSRVSYPTARADAAWRSILLYDEHTWGASRSVSEPSSRLTRVEWAVKSSFARRALVDARVLAAQGLRAYAEDMAGGQRRLVVVNTLSWPRSGLAEVPADLAHAGELLDSSGRPVSLQEVDGRCWLFAPSVPAFGCRVYHVRIRKGTSASQKPRAHAPHGAGWPANSAVENAFYWLRLSHTRGISSIVDRSSGRELLDPASAYGLGQLIYAAGGADTSLHSPRQPHPRITIAAPPWSLLRTRRDSLVLVPEGPFRQAQVQAGPLFTTITLRSSAPAFPAIVTRIRLWNHQKRIDVTIHLHKVAIYRKEAVYVAFPFCARRPRFRLGMAAAIEDPARDFIVGACHEWYAIDNWVACQDGVSGIAWCSPDAPLVTLCHVNRGLWPKTADLANGTIYSYAMNNYWLTNYKAAQGGDMRLRYSFTSSSAPLSNAACERFARSVTAPLIAALTTPSIHTVGRAQGVVGRPGRQAGLLTLSGAGVEAAALRPVPGGSGLMLLLRNTSAQPATAGIAVAWPGCRFQPVNLVGAPEGAALAASRRAGRISASLSLRPYQLRCVKILLPPIPHPR